jgi:hypothetical protein
MKNVNEETSAGGNFAINTPTSGAFIGGKRKKRVDRENKKKVLKDLTSKLDEIWIKHKPPTIIGYVPELAGKGKQPLMVYNTADPDSAAEYFKTFLLKRDIL